MDMYKLATRKKIRISTIQGNVPVELMWDINMKSLESIIKQYNSLIIKEEDSDLDFLKNEPTKFDENKFIFNLLKDIYITRIQEANDDVEALNKKLNNEKILKLIYEKEQEDLKNKSIDELKSMLK